MTRSVRAARNFVVGAGVFIFAGAVFMLVTEPAKWHDWLTEFSVAILCWRIVRNVDKGGDGNIFGKSKDKD